jgi:hypothetical protein
MKNDDSVCSDYFTRRNSNIVTVIEEKHNYHQLNFVLFVCTTETASSVSFWNSLLVLEQGRSVFVVLHAGLTTTWLLYLAPFFSFSRFRDRRLETGQTNSLCFGFEAAFRRMIRRNVSRTDIINIYLSAVILRTCIQLIFWKLNGYKLIGKLSYIRGIYINSVVNKPKEWTLGGGGGGPKHWINNVVK